MIPANLERTLAPTMEPAATVSIFRMILIPIVFLINLIVNEVNVYTSFTSSFINFAMNGTYVNDFFAQQ